MHFSWLNCVKPDIVCLQQMHSTSKAEFDSWVAHETSSSDNIQNTQLFLLLVMLVVVGLPFYLDLFLNKILIFSDNAGRLQVVTLSLLTSDSVSFQLVNVYGPNRKK